ncbi:MAG: MerR family transcriptional regulator [Bacillota bacterium]
MVVHGFTASEVLKLTGLTYRQLDYWASTDFIPPSNIEKVGLKTRRIYSFTDVLAIRAAMRLLDAGIPLQRIRKAVNRLQSELPRKEALHSLVWLTDGENIFILESRDLALDVIRGQYVFAFAVDVGQLADKLEDDVRILEKRQRSRGTQRRYQCPEMAATGM